MFFISRGSVEVYMNKYDFLKQKLEKSDFTRSVAFGEKTMDEKTMDKSLD